MTAVGTRQIRVQRMCYLRLGVTLLFTTLDDLQWGIKRNAGYVMLVREE